MRLKRNIQNITSGRIQREEMNTLVLYHKHCIDGFASAFIWWKKFGDEGHTYRSFNNGEYLNTEEFDRFVFLDCSPKARDVRKILESKKKILMIDHHRSAIDTLERLYSQERTQFEFTLINEEKCTATLVAEYLEVDSPNLKVFLSYIEDRDLSRYNLEKTREISIAISNLGKDFKEWDELLNGDWTTIFSNLYIAGQTLISYQDTIVKIVCKRDYVVWFKHEDLEIPMINSNLYQAEIGKLLCKLLNVKIAGCFSIRGNMANINICGEGVDSIAKIYSGNGNYKYSGFTIPFKEFYDKMRK